MMTVETIAWAVVFIAGCAAAALCFQVGATFAAVSCVVASVLAMDRLADALFDHQ